MTLYFGLQNLGLARTSASEAALYINLVPAITVISAALMLGEALQPSQLAGGVLVILGLYLASR